MKTIAEKYEKLQDKLIRIGVKIKQLREECPHKGVYYSYGASTGNYDPSANSYWVDFNCPHCGIQWRVNQDVASTAYLTKMEAVKI